MTEKEIYQFNLNYGIENGMTAFRNLIKKLSKIRSFETIEKRKAIPKTWIKNKIKIQQHKCATCKKLLTTNDITGDHIEALALGGKHSEKNLRICCKSCNSSKGANSMLEESKKLGKTIAEML